MSNPRELALKSLVKWSESSSFSNIETNTVLTRNTLSEADASLYSMLFKGVIEKCIYLDYAIKQYSKIPNSKIDTETKNILRLSIYQLLFCDRIPEYSAVNEGVNLAKKRSKGFVNGLLRSFLRANKRIKLPKNEDEAFCVKNSIPSDLFELFIKSFDKETAKEILSYGNEKKYLCLRVNTLKVTENIIEEKLKNRGYVSEKSTLANDMLLCDCPISAIKDLIDNGEIFIQDESSRIASQIADAKEGQAIIDTCACPGGKSFSMAIDMKNQGKLYSYDIHKNKLSLIERGALRLGIDIIKTGEQDARALIEEHKGAFDRVLCDVPCSGLGIIFKKPEIKYKSIEDINKLPQIQLDILNNASKYVRVGGYLIYSTCTLNKEENQDNIEKFLLENSDFVAENFQVGNINSQGGVYTFLPHRDKTDGFFVAKMRRVK
ncbi:MAG: 16S rRNA (cytosine(967)-C(5))-methyltransferase RsmB [Clostridia bacterium]|nr:16S rRNA (cytosine(967)-C(5))-methyltransferase RsmB [Clostridia bacterium]